MYGNQNRNGNGNGNTHSTPAAPQPGDQVCQCIDAGKRPECAKEFVFTVGEQKFFTEKGFTPPKRCKPCRDAKKAEKEGSGGGYNASGGYSASPAPIAPSYDDQGGGRKGGGRGKKARRDERDY